MLCTSFHTFLCLLIIISLLYQIHTYVIQVSLLPSTPRTQHALIHFIHVDLITVSPLYLLSLYPSILQTPQIMHNNSVIPSFSFSAFVHSAPDYHPYRRVDSAIPSYIPAFVSLDLWHLFHKPTRATANFLLHLLFCDLLPNLLFHHLIHLPSLIHLPLSLTPIVFSPEFPLIFTFSFSFLDA